MKNIRLLRVKGLAAFMRLLVLAACGFSLHAEVVPILNDTAGFTPFGGPITLTKTAGSAKTLAISSKSTAFISFDTAPTGIQPFQVSAARLTIYFSKVLKPGSVSVHNVNQTFTESFIEKTRPAPTFDSPPFATQPALHREFLTIDVTAQVLTWLATPATGFGVAIKGDATVVALIASKEGAGSGHPAVLEIETTSFLQNLTDDIDTTGFITIRSNATTQPGLDFVFDDGAGSSSIFDLANTPTGAFAISRGGNSLFSISSNAALFSMGTSGTSGGLDVFGDGAVEITATMFSDGADSAPLIVGQRARGTKAAPTAVQAGDELANFNARGFVDGDFSGSRAKVVMSASGNWTSGANGAEISFQTTPNGSAVNGILERMRITHDGRVGIGTTNPTRGAVEIFGARNHTLAGTNGFYGSTGNGSTFASQVIPYSLFADSFIAATGFVAFSDERIKRIEGRSNAARDLSTLRGIEITDYTYIDTATKGAGQQKKVIAQQVEKVFPQAVKKSTDTVPDIYQKATVEDGWVQLATNLKKGERVRLIGQHKEGIHEVLEVAPGQFRTDFVAEGGEVFVYGREVQDFRAVDYEAIAMLNVSATQELAQKLEVKDAEIARLSAELAALKAADRAREARLTRLENVLADRPVRTVRAALDLK